MILINETIACNYLICILGKNVNSKDLQRCRRVYCYLNCKYAKGLNNTATNRVIRRVVSFLPLFQQLFRYVFFCNLAN